MLAYVFWHWKQAAVSTADYETRQQRFHTALQQEPPEGFFGSHSCRVRDVPWMSEDTEIYEDWYYVDSFAALGHLNEAAVSRTRAPAHDRAAGVAAGGAGGLYAMTQGALLSTPPRYACWFGKPNGMTYAQLLALLAPSVAQAGALLWMRQMVLGPAPEFVLHSKAQVSLPAAADMLVVPLDGVWPQQPVG